MLLSGGLVDDLVAAGGSLCFADLADNAIYRMAPGGGATTWLAGISVSDWSCRLASDGSTLFWVTSSTAGQASLSGTRSRILQRGLFSDPAMRVPNSIAADRRHVYWTTILGDGVGFILRAAHD